MSALLRDLSDEAAERDLLGALILAGNRDNITEVVPDLFGTQLHRDIASAVLHLIEHGITLDCLEVRNEMRRRGQNPSLPYLTDLSTGVVLGRPIGRRIEYLRELAERRKLAKLAEELAGHASNMSMALDAIKAAVMDAVR